VSGDGGVHPYRHINWCHDGARHHTAETAFRLRFSAAVRADQGSGSEAPEGGSTLTPAAGSPYRVGPDPHTIHTFQTQPAAR